VPIATTDEQLALPAAIRDWARRSGPLAQVREREPDRGSAGPERRELLTDNSKKLASAGERGRGLPREEVR
jgi:hypothetical protein